MLRKIIRALLGKEEYELNVKVEIDLLDLTFILGLVIAVIWMLLTI